MLLYILLGMCQTCLILEYIYGYDVDAVATFVILYTVLIVSDITQLERVGKKDKQNDQGIEVCAL